MHPCYDLQVLAAASRRNSGDAGVDTGDGHAGLDFFTSQQLDEGTFVAKCNQAFVYSPKSSI